MSSYLPGLLGLLLCQLAGEAITRSLALPVPGPVLGMALMCVLLLARRRKPPESLAGASRGLISILSLLFVPAGVGIISLGPVVADKTPAILISLAISLVVTLVVTAGAYVLTARWQDWRLAERRLAAQGDDTTGVGRGDAA